MFSLEFPGETAFSCKGGACGPSWPERAELHALAHLSPLVHVGRGGGERSGWRAIGGRERRDAGAGGRCRCALRRSPRRPRRAAALPTAAPHVARAGVQQETGVRQLPQIQGGLRRRRPVSTVSATEAALHVPGSRPAPTPSTSHESRGPTKAPCGRVPFAAASPWPRGPCPSLPARFRRTRAATAESLPSQARNHLVREGRVTSAPVTSHEQSAGGSSGRRATARCSRRRG